MAADVKLDLNYHSMPPPLTTVAVSDYQLEHETSGMVGEREMISHLFDFLLCLLGF